ncbi:S8 family peptidase [Haliscomenobacter hydrossis]|uniref:Peptidase S8/S53 domain-containing protein n=1 Tax=Haliscomenobacter hydrossis (strain ATCC 27775 / DSM 1100 / LMG 10767 / O) TaxID=760192 RepID=F4L7W1_HALH1|nr:S8 family peptidase [Haliscomenobacter hydrossis]AEE54469.1 hypothetical protein Halhy_6653 [Haliscomenobacter hydrossis DSM 1100]
MLVNNPKQHIRLRGYSRSEKYKYPRFSGSPDFKRKPQNRQLHGKAILRQLEQIRIRFSIPADQELSTDIIRDDALYVEFTSEWGYSFKFESFNQDIQAPKFQILNVRSESRPLNEEEEELRYHITVMMTKGGIAEFINKVEKYLDVTKKTRNGNIWHVDLVNNIASVQLATLKAFWTDAPEIPFPAEDEVVWWEAWFRKTSNDEQKLANVLQNLQTFEVQIGETELDFPEHRVRLLRGSPAQLAASLLLLDNLAELRKPQETAQFFLGQLEYEDRQEWVADLSERTETLVTEDSVLVCILDSGVNNQHPLLLPFLPNPHLYAYNPSWGVDDSVSPGGHGTGVAGLALYGDLVDALDSPSRIQIYHGLESFKMIQRGSPSDPELYGAITETAVSTPLVDRPFNPRVFCMTITAEQVFFGRPSAWSAAVDKIAFGSHLDPASPQLLILSGGNVEIEKHQDYPHKNQLETVQDPAQAYNAITVGSYTRKDRLSTKGYYPLAPVGAMAPSNSTSLTWDHQWPIKPDIVMEGGNRSTDGVNTWDDDDLQLLSLDSDFHHYLFQPFHSTSAATALAARFAATLRTAYPELWPETIRGLMIHSAEWTSAMRQDYDLNKESERKALLRTVGYGVPLLTKALHSANNSLTLIAERNIQPYQKTNKKHIKYNEYHLYELPWPSKVLANELFDQDVTLKVTLSYFIEPNPGKRSAEYAQSVQYHSHSLEFSVIKPQESIEQFKRRISAYSETPDEETELKEEVNFKGEPWEINRPRLRGSVKKDFFTMSGAEMATRHVIAVYPKSGWYKTRKKLDRANSKVRYSLIVSLETPSIDVDIYTPVENLIAVKVDV